MNGEIKGIDPLVYGLCSILGLGNACINPILYGFLNENFRREYKNLFNRLPLHSSLAGNAPDHLTVNNNDQNLQSIQAGK